MDLFNFVVVLFIVLVSFGTARQAIYYPERDFEWDSVIHIFLEPYFILYGEVYADTIYREFHCSAYIRFIKWTFYGAKFNWFFIEFFSNFFNIKAPCLTADIESDNPPPQCRPGFWITPLLVTIYMLISVLLLLTMLYATFK